jgi:predicted PurR-regulated permease PerM
MLTHERLQFIILSLIFALLGLAVTLIWWPFLKLLVISGILAILFWPFYERMEKRVNNPIMSATATILILLIILIVPLIVLGQMLYGELIGLYADLKDIHISQAQVLAKFPQQFQPWAVEFLTDLGSKAGEFAGGVFTGLSQAVSSAAGFFFSVFLMFFSLYYFLRDGDKIQLFANKILPLSENKENFLVKKLSLAISGVVKGSFLVALIQGSVATIGFYIFQVPNPLLWGSFTVLAALVPNVGTSLSLIPAVLYLFMIDRTGAGIGMAIWGALAVGLIDNVVSPKLIGAQAKLHPVLVLFSVLGGLQLFGFLGFLIGPIIMSMFVVLIEVYSLDLKKYLS